MKTLVPQRLRAGLQPALLFGILLLGVLVACAGNPTQPHDADLPADATPEGTLPPAVATAQMAEQASDAVVTPLPTRTRWTYDTPLPYVAQSGDSLLVLAHRFELTPAEILQANPFLDPNFSTLPPGLPLTLPARYFPIDGSPFKIIPDSELIYGPGQVNFDAETALKGFGGAMATYIDTEQRQAIPAWGDLAYIARYWSVNPRLLIALIEYRSGTVTGPGFTPDSLLRPLGVEVDFRTGLLRQLVWVAEALNYGYYSWKDGSLTELQFSDGSSQRIDPWQNGGTVALHYLFSQWYPPGEFEKATSPQGFAATYRKLFGEPFALAVNHIPGNLRQPELRLPFPPDRLWSYSGGPHQAWGRAWPLASLDFAPPAIAQGCTPSVEPVVAVADGVIAYREVGLALLDLDGDGDVRTGWVIMYLHLKTSTLPDLGQVMKAGDFMGNPSCEGGKSTGTHVHLSRRYNGEWLAAADPVVPFNLDGWVPQAGNLPYAGTMTHDTPAYYLIAYPGVTDSNRVFDTNFFKNSP